MAYSEFGKFVRKLMIDKDENLADLSTLFNCSTSFVSSCLTGKKKAPEGWLNLIEDHYNLNSEEKENLYSSFLQSKDHQCINTENLNTEKKKLLFTLNRRLENLSDDDIETILGVLNK